MSEPDPIQKQRQLLQAFRQATTQRTKLEAVASNHFKAEQEAIDNDLVQVHQTADTERAAAEATAQAKRNAERQAADASLEQARQGSADRFAEVEAANRTARDWLAKAWLVSLLEQARSRPTNIDDRGDPARKLVNSVSAVREAAASISDQVDMLLQARARSHQRRQNIGMVFVVLIIVAVLAFLGWQARQAKVARSALLQAGATARVIAAEGTATARSIVAQGTATAEVIAAQATAAAMPLKLEELTQHTGMEMVYVPPGEFMMGANTTLLGDELRLHNVYLSAYWIDQTEVTVAQFRRCIQAGDCSAPETTDNCNFSDPAKLDHPVNCVDWNQAATYCAWAGKRLPSEAEWEKAARSIDERLYPWGNQVPDATLANFANNIGSTSAVGSYSGGTSPYGALDMAGNVSEWVEDWFDRAYQDYYSQLSDSDPSGPSSGQNRVFRGGSWDSESDYLRTTVRDSEFPGNSHSNLGFRCTLSP